MKERNLHHKVSLSPERRRETTQSDGVSASALRLTAMGFDLVKDGAQFGGKIRKGVRLIKPGFVKFHNDLLKSKQSISVELPEGLQKVLNPKVRLGPRLTRR